MEVACYGDKVHQYLKEMAEQFKGSASPDLLFKVLYEERLSPTLIRNRLIIQEYDRLAGKNIYTVRRIYMELADMFGLKWGTVQKIVRHRKMYH